MEPVREEIAGHNGLDSWRRWSDLNPGSADSEEMVPRARLELATPALRMLCSTN